MSWLNNKSLKLKSAALALILVCGNVFGMALPFMPTQAVSAAAQCTIDQQGTDDEPGQKDLTQMCVDAQASPIVSWQWDDTAWSGSNTGDACALFDNDNNGLVDYAICVTVGGSPAVQQANSPRIYSCGDTKPETCTSPVLVTGPYVTTCSVNTSGDDPFDVGTDTKASCTVKPSEVGSGELLDVCSYPSQQPNSDFSDCIIFEDNTAKLEVKKVLNPTNDPGLFDLKIGSTTYANDVGNGGTTGQVVVDKGTVTVTEAENAPTDLAQYTTTVVCRDLNGTGAIVAQSSPTGSDTRQLSFTIIEESDVVCTFTNTRLTGNLTVVKNLIKDNGATQSVTDFGFKVNGGTTTPFEADSSNTVAYPSGTVVSVTEPTVAGFATSYSNCSNLTIVAGQTQTCTITNNDIAPTLTLVKTVTNNNGGTKTASDFQAKIDGNNTAWSTAVPLSAGAHTASEVGLSTYAASVWGGDCATDGTITLTVGQNATCTITNDDKAPSLTLNKIVSNTHGGTATESAWTLTATGPTTLTGAGASGSTDVVSGSTFAAGTYILSESSGPLGYSASSWTCTNDVTVTSGQITLANGQTTVCNITNSDVAPIMTIIKSVINPYGTALPASSFPLFVDNTSVTSGVSTTQFDAGSHIVTETQQPGYSFTGVSGDCTYDNDIISILLNLAQASTCTLTNTAIQPKLTITKVVINNNGGSKVVADFPLFVNQTSVTSGTQNGFNEGTYTVSETSQTGYTGTITGDCASDGKVTLNVGDVKSCTITNDDKAPKLTLKKIVINDNSGESEASDWTLTATPKYDDEDLTGNSLSGNGYDGFVEKDAQSHVTYTLDEEGPYDYVAGEWSCYSTAGTFSNPYGKDDEIRMSEGANVICTIINDDVAHPSIHVVKSGPATAYEGDTVTYTFTVTNTGDVALDGITVNDNIAGAGTYQSGDTNNNDVLETTETWIYTAKYKILANQVSNVENTVTVCSSERIKYDDHEHEDHEYEDDDYEHEDHEYDEYDEWIKEVSNNGEICDTDDHTLDVLHPSINVVKSGPATAQAGNTVLYKFTVTNTGDVALANLTVVDSLTGDATYVSGDTNDNDMLDLSETWVYNGNYTIPAGQTANVLNTVKVCAKDQRVLVCDEDKHSLGIPQVLGETKLIDTGTPLNPLYNLLALFNLAAGLGVIVFTKKQKLNNK